jgi:hypothetical protein
LIISRGTVQTVENYTNKMSKNDEKKAYLGFWTRVNASWRPWKAAVAPCIFGNKNFSKTNWPHLSMEHCSSITFKQVHIGLTWVFLQKTAFFLLFCRVFVRRLLPFVRVPPNSQIVSPQSRSYFRPAVDNSSLLRVILCISTPLELKTWLKAWFFYYPSN